jgi:hypothetical protein
LSGAEQWWESEEWSERLEQKLAQLGTRTPSCCWEACEEICPFMLTGADPEIYCSEHEAIRHGRPWLQAHHPPGQHNDPRTILLPANYHSVLSELQYRWPRETLRNADGSPLLQAAALTRGLLDVLYVVIVIASGVPVLLENLDAFLRERLGERWWDDVQKWLDSHG